MWQNKKLFTILIYLTFKMQTLSITSLTFAGGFFIDLTTAMSAVVRVFKADSA